MLSICLTLSQILSIRFCQSSISCNRSGLMKTAVSCQCQSPPTTCIEVEDMPTSQRTRPLHTETQAQSGGTCQSTKTRPQNQAIPKEEAEGGGVTGRSSRQRRSFSTTLRYLAASCSCGCVPTRGSLLPAPPWSGGRSQDRDTPSQ